jgi:hypothetical protein
MLYFLAQRESAARSLAIVSSSKAVVLFTYEVEPSGGFVTAQARRSLRAIDDVAPQSVIFVPASETSNAKNSQPSVLGNLSRGCFTIASKGTSWRMGYATASLDR